MRPPPPSLLLNSAAYVVGQVVSRALGLILLLAYARFLQPADFGLIGTLGAYGAVLSTIFVMGLHGAVSRHFFDHRGDARRLAGYLTGVYAFQALASLALTAVALSAGAGLWRRFTANSIAFHPYVELMLWTTFLGALATIPQAIYQTRERARVVVGWQLAQGVLALCTGVLFVAVLRQGAIGVLRTQLVAAGALAAVFLVLFARQHAGTDLRRDDLRSALRFGLPLLPHALGSILLQTVDRIMLERYAPLAQVGLYSIAMTLGMTVPTVAGGINQAWAPHFLRTMREEPEAVARGKAETFAALFVALLAGLTVLGGVLAPELARLLLGARYEPAVPFLVPFLIGTLIGVCYLMPANQLFLVERTIWFPVATGLATVVSIGLNAWLLPRGGGGMAAAWIFVAGNVCQAGVILLAARRYQRSLLGARHALVVGATFLGLLATGAGLPLAGRAAIGAAAIGAAWLLLVRGNLRHVFPPRPHQRTKRSTNAR